MKLYAPEYYKNFKCIADKCPHSCCVGWEIDVDEDALEKYRTLSHPYGAVISDSISTEDTPHFKLCHGDRCPHLNEQGLCNIILSVGEDYLCQICREHPRFYNYTDVAEVGLGMSCIQAARIILSSPRYYVTEQVGQVDAEADGLEFDGRAARSRLYALLCASGDYAERLEEIYRQYEICAGEDSEWLEIIDSLEYLDHAHRKLFMSYAASRRPVGKNEYLERALAYFIYRHCTEAFDAEDFRARLAFCLFCERLLAALICAEGAQSLEDVALLASIISEEIEYSDDNTAALMR